MTQQYKAILKPTDYGLAVPKAERFTLKTGEYQDAEGNSHYSTISLWVPIPRTPEHIAGIFIRLHNADSSTMARLTWDEYQMLQIFLDDKGRHLEAAYHWAETQIRQIRS